MVSVGGGGLRGCRLTISLQLSTTTRAWLWCLRCPPTHLPDIRRPPSSLSNHSSMTMWWQCDHSTEQPQPYSQMRMWRLWGDTAHTHHTVSSHYQETLEWINAKIYWKINTHRNLLDSISMINFLLGFIYEINFFLTVNFQYFFSFHREMKNASQFQSCR